MQIDVINVKKDRALTVAHILTKPANTFPMVSLHRALEKKWVEIREVSESGSVNNISVWNHSEHYVLITDGDILKGAKQNRTSNTSVLLAPHSKIILPVSCVERGRWRPVTVRFVPREYSAPEDTRRYDPYSFEPDEYSAPKDIRRIKMEYLARQAAHAARSRSEEELGYGRRFGSEGHYGYTRSSGSSRLHDANQGEVWRQVDDYLRKTQTHAPTDNLSDIYQRHKGSLDTFLQTFQPVEHANGVAFFLNDQIFSIDIFNNHEVYCDNFPKLLRGIAFDAFRIRNFSESFTENDAISIVNEKLNKFDHVNFSIVPGVALGEEKRYSDQYFTAFELTYEGHLIHRTMLFPTEIVDSEKEGPERKAPVNSPESRDFEDSDDFEF